MEEGTPIEMDALPSGSPKLKVVTNSSTIQSLKQKAPQKEYVYDFMRSDTYAVSGLQDWPERKWAKNLYECPLLAVPFVGDFFQNGEMNDESIQTTRHVAKMIKETMNHPLLEKQWLAVLKFQNGLKHTQPWTEQDWRLQLAEHSGEELADRLLQELGLVSPMRNSAHARRASFEMMQENVDCPVATWKAMYEFQMKGKKRNAPDVPYLDHMLRAHVIFDREFPLGVEDHVLDDATRDQFVIKHSGLTSVKHTTNKLVSFALFGVMAVGVFTLLVLLIKAATTNDWVMEATTTIVGETKPQDVINRTKNRAFVASLFSTLAFSLTVNASIDKYGKIDPSTSTVLVGMTVGNTFGFVLDNMLGSDEGFREYLWSTTGGMQYAIGALGTRRYARYIVTILFDMFFTVILFKRLYSVIVRLAGFSAEGREWIANGMSSAFISTITFQVYANMTRLQWAYPSGSSGGGLWISGSTMVLAVVTMNIVYLIDETRCSVGERGINDPPVKIFVTIFTFALLAGLQNFGAIDPAFDERTSFNNFTLALADPNMRLEGVCGTIETFSRGLAVFMAIVLFCFGFVIFGTSSQTIDGLKTACYCPCFKPSALEGKSQEKQGSIALKVILFVMYVFIVFGILLFFAVIPLWSHSGQRIVDDC